MPDFYAGCVTECPSETELVVLRRNGTEVLVENAVPHETDYDSVELGDLVKIEERPSYEDRAVDIYSRNGFSSGNIPAVVEDVFDGTAIVRTDNGLSTVTRVPDHVNAGETIQVTAAMTYHGHLSDSPPDIDDLLPESETSDDDYEWRYEEDISVTLEDVGGLDHVKRAVREQIIQPLDTENEELRETLDVTLSQGLLFYGPAGTGKTRTAKAVTNHVDGDLFIVDGPELVSKYYGETERQIRDVFQEAERAAEASGNPSIVFFDELDSMAPSRGQADETERRIVAQLLSELDGFDERGDIIVIGATNLVDEIDQAILRPGRFDSQLEFSKPDREAREAILQISLGDTPIADDVNLTVVAEQTEEFTGADLAAVVDQAKYLALQDGEEAVRMEHLRIGAARRQEAQE
ncbi:ATP-binding protein [Halolamina salina]|uniref:ATP-binding protein n=1 Tax=Halolamina salina TaxID=1220023 RepID=A0ABD6BB29_9EURY